MGASIRSFDWTGTVLGPIHQWPQSLTTAIQIMLGSRYPMFIWWGSGFLNFYNDAYIPVLGKRHPWALGRSAQDVWHEIWHNIGPQAQFVLDNGQATWNDQVLLVMERNGYTEETYFTFSYSPVPGEGGGIGAVFCACTEDTERVLSVRRLNTLRHLSTRSTVAHLPEDACTMAAEVLAENTYDVPFSLVYLLDNGAAHARLVAASGIEPESVDAPPLVDISPASQSERWPLAQALQGQTITVRGLQPRLLPGGPWPEPTHTAVVLPLIQGGHTEPLGFVVLGVSPRLKLDDGYLSFIELVAGSINSAVAKASSYDEERRRADALAELDRAKTQFFSNVSHEFRTPLTLLLGPLEDTLATRSQLPPPAQQAVAVAHRNALRLLRLVNSLLDFTRIEEGRTKAVYEPLDLSKLTLDLASCFRSATERAGLFLETDLPALAEPVWVDREMWEKIVLNLLSNAFKFTFQGGITVRLVAQNGYAELSVSDTGTGIPGTEIPHLFQRFHRVEGAQGRSFEGSGIGLALIQELVILHGGSIGVESMVDRGSTFKVLIPFGNAHLPETQRGISDPASCASSRADAFVQEALRWLPDTIQAPGAIINPSQAMPGDSALSGTKAGRILVADDNSDMLNYVRRLLESNYEILVAGDGQSALNIAIAERPDLILSDIMMPGLDGFGLLRAIRENPALRTTPVILLSARAGEEARSDGIDLGADDYLVKPFSARELVARVGTNLKLARLRRETDAALEDERRLLKEIVDHLPVGVMVTDSSGSATMLNNALADIWRGSRPLETVDQYKEYAAWDIDTGRMIEPHDWPVSRALATGVAQGPSEYAIRRFDGTEGRLLTTAVPIIDASGKTIAGVAVAQDMTERAKTEQALRESEARQKFLLSLGDQLRELVDPVAIQSTAARALGQHLGANRVGYAEDLDGIHVSVTGNFTHGLSGLKGVWRYEDYGQALVGDLRAGRTVVHSDVAKDVNLSPEEKAAHALLQLGATMNVPLVKGDRLLAILFVHYKTSHIFSEKERTLVEDVAERTWAAVERAQAEEKLRQSQSTLQSFYDSAPFMMGIAELDGDRTIPVSGNRAMADFFLHRSAELPGNSSTESGDPAEFERLSVETFRRTQGEGVPVSFDYEYPRHAGSRWLTVTSAFIGIANSGKPRFSFVAEDTTARKRAEFERQEYADHLQRANEDLLHFAYAVSHDLQAPLRTTSAFSQLLALKCKDKLDAEGDRFIRAIVAGASRMSTMISDLLEFARVAGQEFQPEAVSLEEALAAALYNLSAEINDAGATIHREPLPLVAGNKGQMVHLLQNLIGNAIKYRKPDVAPIISISAVQKLEQTAVSVRDNGIGFEQAQAARVFDVFQRLNKDFSGTGIGLTICKRIVERSGGRIWATAEPGEGATFSFSLPLAGASADLNRAGGTLSVERSSPNAAKFRPDRKQPGAEASALEEVFEALLHSPTIIFSLDGTIRVWTRGAERLYGWSTEEATGRQCHQLLQTIFPKPFPEILTDLLRDGVWLGELEQVARDGRSVISSSHWTLHRDGAGRPQSIIKVNADITPLKTAERAVRESEQRFRLAATAARLGIHDYDPRTGQIVWDERVRELWGLSPEQPVTYSVFMDGVHPDDRAATQKAIDEALDPAGNGQCLVSYRVISKADGSEHWIETTGKAFFEHERAIRLVGTMLDVTEQRRVAQALAEHDAQIRQMIDSIDQLAWMAYGDGYIFWYNRRWYEYTGTEPGQMEGWGWQSVHDPQVLSAVVERWTNSIRTGERFDMEFPLRGADGVFRSFLTRVTPLRDDQGIIVRWFGTNTNIDALHRGK
jgi:PAS domain S-box-containing protein